MVRGDPAARFRNMMETVLRCEGISQRTLAKRMGVSEARVSQMLKDGNPTLATLERICIATNRYLELGMAPC